ncbi:MAG: glycosyltransferase family 4 protein [Bacteroidia bacterium]|nr:glycosyltransferase family 4 protein [Bacteroidia bacterium]
MKVLILHQHYKTPETGGALRSYFLAKALVGAGIEAVVITAHNEKKYKTETQEGIEVHYLPIAYNNRFGFEARSLSFLKYVWCAVRLASKIKGINYCYAISVPLTVGVAAMSIKKRNGIPYIFEVGDLWPDAPIQMGFIKNYFFQQALFSLERSIYKSAESIIALSPAIKTAIEKKIPGKSIHMIPNMADTEYFKPEPKLPYLEDKFVVKNKFVVSYIGAIGVANGLDYFIECANASRKAELPIQFLLCGDGALLERLKRNAKHLGLQNLSFIDFVNREGVQEVMKVTDASFVCYKNLPILETGSPNKYFDGLAAGKLIVINFGGWIKKEIEEAGCGIYVNPLQPTDFVKKIRPFLSDQKFLLQYQASSRTLAERKYSRRQLSEAFSKLFP